MKSYTPLHTLIYAPEEKTSGCVKAAMVEIFPAIQFVDHRDVKAVLKALDEAAFDLIILVMDRVDADHVQIFEKIRSQETSMPVTALIASDLQDRFHEIVPDFDSDWSLVFSDQMTWSGLARAIQNSINRAELRWERNHLHQAFRSSMLQYRNLFDEVPDIIFLTDRSGCLLDVNATASRVFGQSKDAMLLKPIFDSMGMPEKVFHQLVRSATDPKGPIRDLEVEFHPPEGPVVHGLTHMITWQQTRGRSVLFQGVIKDITQHKQLESQLRDSELQYKALYELAQISSSSLQLERVAARSLKLIVTSCKAAGALLLINRCQDRLEILAGEDFDSDRLKEMSGVSPIQLGRGIAGHWAIGSSVQTLNSDGFDGLEPVLREWADKLGVHGLVGCPMGSANMTVPASIMIVGFSDSGSESSHEELLVAMAKTLEMGMNNCHHYANSRAAENKYHDLWEHAPAFFLSIIKGGMIFEVNQTMADALGYEVPGMIGWPLTEFIDPEDAKEFWQHHTAIVEHAREEQYEIKMRKREGGFLIASIHSEPLLNKDGVIIGEKAVLYDITQRKRLEAELRDYTENLERMVAKRTGELTETMTFLNGILEGTTEYAIFGLDETGVFVHFNRGAELILHYDPEEMVHRRSLDFLTKVDDGEGNDLSSFLKAVDTRGVLVREVKMRTGDGREIAVQLSVNRLHSKAPGGLTYVGIARDITEQKHLEKLLKDYNENLEREIKKKIAELDQQHIQLIQSSKLATLGEMVTSIAHEMNQPLSGIRTRAQLTKKMIENGRATDEKTLVKQEEVMDLVDRITHTIDHMRIFSRQDQQPFTPFDVRQSVEGCMSLLGAQLRLQEIDVEVDIPADSPLIRGEPSQIEQVLLNLVSNAQYAMEKKFIKNREKPDGCDSYHKKLSIRLEKQSEEEICLMVQDNGTGMDAKDREHIFEPFYTTKPVGEGTGLGLSISYGIITNHQGRIEVESCGGGGTIFKIYIPTWRKGTDANPPEQSDSILTVHPS